MKDGIVAASEVNNLAATLGSLTPLEALGIMKFSLVHAKGLGVMVLGSRKLVTQQSVQPIASMSKAFTAVAVMQLVERGLLDIDRPYVDYVPYFELHDDRYPQITIRHLLAHNSGFPWITDAEFYDFGKDPWGDDGAMERYVRSRKDMDITLDFDPGAPESFAYSNMGYDILGDLIHKVSGELFEPYCAEHILEPLGMSHATFLKSQVTPGLLQGAHTRDEDNNVIPCPYYPYDRKHAPSAWASSERRSSKPCNVAATTTPTRRRPSTGSTPAHKRGTSSRWRRGSCSVANWTGSGTSAPST